MSELVGSGDLVAALEALPGVDRTALRTHLEVAVLGCVVANLHVAGLVETVRYPPAIAAIEQELPELVRSRLGDGPDRHRLRPAKPFKGVCKLSLLRCLDRKSVV